MLSSTRGTSELMVNYATKYYTIYCVLCILSLAASPMLSSTLDAAIILKQYKMVQRNTLASMYVETHSACHVMLLPMEQ